MAKLYAGLGTLDPVFEEDSNSFSGFDSTAFDFGRFGDTLSFIEKRIFRRLETELPVELEVEGVKLEATTRNISCGGMFLDLKPRETGEELPLNLTIHLPKHQNPVRLVGKIKRSEKEGVAVEFQGLYNDNTLLIDQFVKSNLN